MDITEEQWRQTIISVEHLLDYLSVESEDLVGEEFDSLELLLKRFNKGERSATLFVSISSYLDRG